MVGANSKIIRLATYNLSFDREVEGQIYNELAAGDVAQICNVAEILQRTRPDVVVLTEFDHDGTGKDASGVQNFISNYLGKSQNNAKTIDYPYYYLAPTNTGELSNIKFNKADSDPAPKLPADGYGFGAYHGQYAFVILSKYPIDTDRVRSFRKFLWKDMPGAVLPEVDGKPYFTEADLAELRLSSKNHVDVPVTINGKTLHVLAMHPTPPVFDGEEKRNARRNHDEIRLFSDYISTAPEISEYLIDDLGNKGGLNSRASFFIAGDFNADPVDGDSWGLSIKQLLQHGLVNTAVTNGTKTPSSAGGAEFSGRGAGIRLGDSSHWTQTSSLRLDYVIPSSDLEVVGSGVYWEPKSSLHAYLVEVPNGEEGKGISSDHRLVWVDVLVK